MPAPAPGPPAEAEAAAAAPGSPAPPTASATAGITTTAVPRGGYQVRPSYPRTARRLGIEGTTLLRVHVEADGRVAQVQVEQSGGHPDLDRAAADAVTRWQFQPARRGSERVSMWVLIPVQFRLR
ncbi:MAG: energy transducer TonB [Candidatus Rokubacteria bacterium]|nr:energy transducer TonB [Candidatus Rokubacteria bacterium]